jgi:hypothetical protein
LPANLAAVSGVETDDAYIDYNDGMYAVLRVRGGFSGAQD